MGLFFSFQGLVSSAIKHPLLYFWLLNPEF